MPHALPNGDPPPIVPEDSFYRSDYEKVAGPLSIAIELSMVFANLFPLWVVLKLKKKKERVVTDELIAVLSLTDMLSVLVPSPLGILSYVTKRWWGGSKTCDLYHLTIIWFQLASMCLITYMCVDRWLALRVALLYKNSKSARSRMREVVFGIYVSTLFVGLVPVMGMAPRAMQGELCQSWLIAQPRASHEHVFYILFLVIGYSNLLVTVIVNYHLLRTLCLFRRTFSADQNRGTLLFHVDQRTVTDFTLLILIVTIVFYLTWLPVLLMVSLQKGGVQVSSWVLLYALLSTSVSGILNPVIYAVFSQSYRNGYKTLGAKLLHYICGIPKQNFSSLNDVSATARRMRRSCSESSAGWRSSSTGMRTSSRPSSTCISEYSARTSMTSSGRLSSFEITAAPLSPFGVCPSTTLYEEPSYCGPLDGDVITVQRDLADSQESLASSESIISEPQDVFMTSSQDNETTNAMETQESAI